MTVNVTMLRFGYPQTLIHAYANWVVLLREDQATLGSLILCSTSDATSFSDLDREAFTELHQAVGDIESALDAALAYDKINYLMLMMSDPNVHYHVLPRYASPRTLGGITLADKGWPKAPVLSEPLTVDAAQRDALCDALRARWPRGG